MRFKRVKKGSFGQTLIATCKTIDYEILDISQYPDDLYIRFYKPDGEPIDKPAEILTDGLDGKMRYIVEEGLLDDIGKWSFEGLILNTSVELPSNKYHFRVYG